jgi:DNA-directed RNA polymerase subunit RPC12/RpoP
MLVAVAALGDQVGYNAHMEENRLMRCPACGGRLELVVR